MMWVPHKKPVSDYQVANRVTIESRQLSTTTSQSISLDCEELVANCLAMVEVASHQRNFEQSN